VTAWDEPTFLTTRFPTPTNTLTGRFSDLQMADRDTWVRRAGEPPGFAAHVIRVAPFSTSQVHEIYAVDPASTGYIEPPERDRGRVVPAGKLP